jgi:hypothetical protein
LGSPLTCLDSSVVSGILLNDQSCSASGSYFLLNYLSLGPSASWINEVTSDDSVENPRFTVDVMHYFNNISDAVQRCTGTIISDNRILTTASCVLVEKTKQIAIQSFIGGTRERVNTRNVFIHPDYKPSQHREANVAVVEVCNAIEQ